MKLPELPSISPELRKEAERIIADRAEQYGDAKPCFTLIARKWHECLREYSPSHATTKLPSYMVGLMMAAFKEARLEMCDGMSEDKQKDDIIDRYNYIKLARNMVERQD